MLDLADLVAQFLIGLIPEVAHVEHDVHLVGTVGNGQSGLGNLGLDVGLAGGEAGAAHGHVNAAHLEGAAHDRGKVAVDTDGGHILVLRIVGLEVIDPLYKLCHAALAVVGGQRGQIHAVEQELLHLGGVVLGSMLVDEFLHGSTDGSVIGGDVALVDGGHVLVHGLVIMLVIVMLAAAAAVFMFVIAHSRFSLMYIIVVYGD